MRYLLAIKAFFRGSGLIFLKSFIIIIVLAPCIMPLEAFAVADMPGLLNDSLLNETKRIIEGIDFTPWQETILRTDPKSTPPDFAGLIFSMIRGDTTINGNSLLESLSLILLDEAKNSLPLLFRLIAPAILCGVLTKMQSGFESKGVSEVSYFACYLLIAVSLASDFAAHANSARQTMDNMATFMQALFPTLITLLTAVGSGFTSGVFQPAILGAASLAGTILRDAVLTLALIAAVLTVLNNLSEHIKVARLLDLCKTFGNWVLGVSLTVFLGVLTIQGAISGVFDGISVRTAKYAIDNFVPVVGGIFADTVDTLVGCSVIVKNAVGIAGMFMLVGICLIPVIRIAVAILFYRLAAALLEPAADGRIVKCLYEFSQVMTMMCITVLSAAAMFFLMTTLLLAAGNMSVMLR